MKIITFSTNYLPHLGGAELALKEITDRIDDCEFTLITARLEGDRPSKEKIGSVQIYRIGFGSRIDVYLLAVFGWVKALYFNWQKGFDLCWSMMASQGSIAAAVFGWTTGTPLVLTLQEGNEEQHLKRYVGGSDLLFRTFIRPIHRFVFHIADHITAISSHLSKRAKRVVSDTAMTIIPNGVDLDAFDCEFAEKETNKLRSQYADKSDVLVISTSRLAKKNAVGDLIASLTHLPEKYKLLVLGEGERRKALEKKVRELNLKKQVFLPGPVAFAEIPRYLHAADVFCRPSLSEGMGNSFIEAMATKTPVVATPVGGILDFLEHEKTGLFAEVENPKSIAKQIQRLQENSDLRNTVVENAYTMVTERYNWDTIAKKYRKVFSELISSST
jgi:glycosyltransferase involved in cell wall biosynthesis